MILNKKVSIKFEAEVWKLLAVAILLALIPYLFWEIFWYLRIGPMAIKWHTYLVAALLIIFLFSLPLKPFIFFRKFFLLGSIYLGLSLIIGEKHPFTRVPMYTNFKNEARVIMVSDENDKPIKYNANFLINSGSMMHKYSSMQSKLQSSPNLQEADKKEIIGKSLLSELYDTRQSEAVPAKLKLYLLTYYLNADTIACRKEMLYAAKTN
jgi:hypothetical protein